MHSFNIAASNDDSSALQSLLLHDTGGRDSIHHLDGQVNSEARHRGLAQRLPLDSAQSRSKEVIPEVDEPAMGIL